MMFNLICDLDLITRLWGFSDHNRCYSFFVVISLFFIISPPNPAMTFLRRGEQRRRKVTILQDIIRTSMSRFWRPSRDRFHKHFTGATYGRSTI